MQHPSPGVAPEALVTAARQAAEAAMKGGVPGVQIAVFDDGRIIYSEAFGVTDRESATATTPRSVLQVGSVTKQFTAAAILRLAERGALTLDDRIEKHVPELDPRGATITLRQLLSHTAGVRREWFPPTSQLDLTAPVTRQEVVKALNEGQLLDLQPGKAWSYSNAGYMLLGLAIESITGMSFADFIHHEFVLPLGLMDTGLCGMSHLPPLPHGYAVAPLNPSMVTPSPLLHTSVLLSAGGLCSTASDLTRWAHLLATGRVLLPDSYATMTTPARLENNTVLQNGYALGILAQKRLGHSAVWHDGITWGFMSSLFYFPDHDLAVSVVTNAWPGPSAGDAELLGLAVANAALATQ